MSIIKTGRCDGDLKISSAVYICDQCGNTEMANECSSDTKKCNRCDSSMKLVISESDK